MSAQYCLHALCTAALVLMCVVCKQIDLEQIHSRTNQSRGPHQLHTKQICMKLIKAYKAKLYCNQLSLILQQVCSRSTYVATSLYNTTCCVQPVMCDVQYQLSIGDIHVENVLAYSSIPLHVTHSRDWIVTVVAYS